MSINYSGFYHAASAERHQKSEAQPAHCDLNDFRLLHWHGCFVDKITAVLDPPQWHKKTERRPPEVEDVHAWLDSIAIFMELGPESGPGEDYIWRTIVGDNHVRSLRMPKERSSAIEVPVACFIRKAMRQQPIDTKSLTVEEEEALQYGFFELHLRWPHLKNLDEKLAQMKKDLPYYACCETLNRTIFKTQKSMLGFGHLAIQEGDVVTLMQGLGSPIVLRPRVEEQEGGFTFVGDAYVDGIMHGEFLRTEPVFRGYDIY